jgi:phospholipid transport system transporter-binding protein
MIAREGNRLVVRGAITLANVTALRAAGIEQIDRDDLTLDLAGVDEADSSALSLLLEWQRAAKARGFTLKYSGLPENLRSLARVYGILELLMPEVPDTGAVQHN